MFDFQLGFKEEIIVVSIALIGFGHKKLFELRQRIKRFITE
jgi:Sec-independent protein translocase protein TatA